MSYTTISSSHVNKGVRTERTGSARQQVVMVERLKKSIDRKSLCAFFTVNAGAQSNGKVIFIAKKKKCTTVACIFYNQQTAVTSKQITPCGGGGVQKTIGIVIVLGCCIVTSHSGCRHTSDTETNNYCNRVEISSVPPLSPSTILYPTAIVTVV